MDWTELLQMIPVLALLSVPPILFAWILQWARRRRRPEGKPHHLLVYGASCAVWFSVLLVGVPSMMRSPPVGMSQSSIDAMPAFPWPPPLASAETMIPDNWLPARGGADLASVASTLESALRTAKYRKWSYSSAPDGFALVSQMEQVKSDGTPSPEPARWSAEMPSVGDMSLLEFIKALANAQPGYYRVIVFIVTDKPWSRTGENPTREEADRWLARGFGWLPSSIGALPYGPDYRTTALVYEFKKASEGADATLIEPSPTSADDHLRKAGISEGLSRR